MKAYGIPRNTDIESPDVADIGEYGLSSRYGRLPGKGGDIRSMFKNADSKRSARRRYKRKARAEGKRDCREVY